MIRILKNNKHDVYLFVGALSVTLMVLVVLLPFAFREHYFKTEVANVVLASSTPEEVVFVPTYVETPEPLKGIYMTSWIASSKQLRENLVKIADETEINTILIDIKDYSGKIVFPIENNPKLKAFGSEEVRVRDLKEFIQELHKKNIYVIGRVAVFQDAYFVKHRPDLAVKTKDGSSVWKDRKGISWIDSGSREYWDYIIEIAKESHKIGFDEINFDYIRFPSDGNMKDISYPFSSTTPKVTVMKNFFEYLHKKIESDPELEGLKTSADLFGMVTNTYDDMGIGQVLENTLPYFDYIMPMVYPSHYPTNFQGYKEPEAYPYEIIKFAMSEAVVRSEALASSTGQNKLEYKNKMRPWLQDFGLRMTYGSTEVRAQIKATNDVGLSSWILWSPSNKYTRGALQ
jgi:hypothetical protein